GASAGEPLPLPSLVPPHAASSNGAASRRARISLALAMRIMAISQLSLNVQVQISLNVSSSDLGRLHNAPSSSSGLARIFHQDAELWRRTGRGRSDRAKGDG